MIDHLPQPGPSKHAADAPPPPSLRNIDKAGGLDAYILNTPDKYLQSDIAIDLKIQMLQKLVREQALREAPTGLPAAAQAVLDAEPSAQ